MSIFDAPDIQFAAINSTFVRINVEKEHPYLCGHTAEEYKSLSDAYYKIREFYMDFFMKFWTPNAESASNNVNNQTVQHKVREYSNLSWTEDEYAVLKDYIDKLRFPATYSEIIDFLLRVLKGDLEFLCRFPIKNDINGECSLDILKSLNIQICDRKIENQ